MADYTLIIGNKNYSSWSLRAWLMLTVPGIPFEENLIVLATSSTRQEILRYSPSGKVPVLVVDEDLKVWDTLAIGEYLHENHPEAGLWPEDPVARARARAVSAEMHSGFMALRQNMPMNIRSSFPGLGRAAGVQDDINRIAAIWRNHRRRVDPADGPFLFGRFSIADAMFAPVVSRFRTFAVELADETAQTYADAVWNMPAMQAWAEASRNEPMVIDRSEF